MICSTVPSGLVLSTRTHSSGKVSSSSSATGGSSITWAVLFFKILQHEVQKHLKLLINHSVPSNYSSCWHVERQNAVPKTISRSLKCRKSQVFNQPLATSNYSSCGQVERQNAVPNTISEADLRVNEQIFYHNWVSMRSIFTPHPLTLI